MRVLVCLLVAVCAVNAYPRGLDDKWQFVPDGSGRMHLIDITADAGPEGRFDAPNDMIFRLYTPDNPTEGQVIRQGDVASVSNSNYNAANPTRLIIHGWNNNGMSPVNTNIRSAYMQRGAFNVITVDWGVGANTINYLSARNRINDVGVVVAELLDFLNESFGMAFSDCNIVGHSLGAHAAGISGKRVNRGQIYSITGLDPALPLFGINSLDRLDVDDAFYTETIHTNAGLLGFDVPITRSSFYPNFGSSQPGCGIDLVGNCAHSRAVDFYAESINTSIGFFGRQCRGYQDILDRNCVGSGPSRVMGGEPSNTIAEGVFWLPTNNNSPFARGPI